MKSNPETTPEAPQKPGAKPLHDEEGKRTYFVLLHLLLLILLVVTGVMSYQKNEAKENEKRQNSTHELQLQAMHSKGYDQGYLNAIWDTFLGVPLYQVQEVLKADGTPDITLWKQQEIDPGNRQRLNASLQDTNNPVP
jgi:hypothetical protein